MYWTDDVRPISALRQAFWPNRPSAERRPGSKGKEIEFETDRQTDRQTDREIPDFPKKTRKRAFVVASTLSLGLGGIPRQIWLGASCRV